MEDNLNLNPERSDFSAADSNDVAANQISAGQTTKNGGEASADTGFDTSQRPWTPGPWSVNKPYSAGPADMIERGSVSTSRKEDMIFLHGYDSRSLKANAHLIAAAPDLYEALETLLGYVDSPCGGCGESCAPQPIFAQARAALAKARGEGVE